MKMRSVYSLAIVCLTRNDWFVNPPYHMDFFSSRIRADTTNERVMVCLGFFKMDDCVFRKVLCDAGA